MTTETNEGDIVRCLKRQMEEMNKQMNIMMKMNTEVIIEKSCERGGGLGAFGTSTNIASAQWRVDLPTPPILHAAAGSFDSPPPAQRHGGDLDPGSGNPHNRKLPWTLGFDGVGEPAA